jgi:hypothetical protein
MQSHLDKIQNDFANGNFENETKDIDIKTANNLDLLIDATALFHENKFRESDAAFEEFNKRNISETSSSISRETASLLFGGGVNSYKPYMMDSLFVSYYQIWNLLALNDWSNARVVINQSYERQKNMSIEYEKLVAENKTKLANAIELKNELNKNQADWAAFSDIMNPALMYLSGIYFLNDGDFATAETYLKRANGMAPENTAIKSDLKNAQNHIRPTNTTWVFTESGFAPRLREENFGLFLPSIGMVYFNVSTPQFIPTAHTPQDSEILNDVDKMFMTEFNEYRTNEILRTYTSTVAKTALQSTMYNSGSKSAPLMGILSTIYTISSSNSDVRTWATLPKYISVKRIDTTNLKDIDLDDKIESNISDNNLIYIREHDTITDKKIIKLKPKEKK